MLTSPKPPRTGSCLLFSILLICLLVIIAIVIPTLITSKAAHVFGEPTPQLSYRQRVYLSTLILLQARDLTQPVNPDGSKISFTITPGESVSSIAKNLLDAGLITDPGVFSKYLQYAGLDISLKAGDYKLSPAMPPIEIAKTIHTSISADVTLTILPGWRMEEIASSLPSTGYDISTEEFLNAVENHPVGYSFSSCLPDDSLEGYLFPGSYTMVRGTTIDQLISQILSNFETQISTDLQNGFTSQGLNLCQAVTLASIIQREAMVEDEMPLIASVFYNRLNSGDELASDPTVQYALGFNQIQKTWWTNPLSTQDLQVISPYNTYIHAGLPPGPICNPGLSALKAVASPAQTNYYYFRAACDGSGRHTFAQTYAQHLANACP